jgi:hypothetical protein
MQTNFASYRHQVSTLRDLGSSFWARGAIKAQFYPYHFAKKHHLREICKVVIWKLPFCLGKHHWRENKKIVDLTFSEKWKVSGIVKSK